MSGTKKIVEIATDTLEVISKVVDYAIEGLNLGHEVRNDQFANVNTLTGENLSREIQSVNLEKFEKLRKLAKEPIIGRIEFYDEGLKRSRTMYISRNSAPAKILDYTIVSYFGPYARINTFNVGDCDEVNTPNGICEFRVESTAKLHPIKENGRWDSIDNELDIITDGKFTIPSFVKLLTSQIAEKDEVSDEEIDSLWEDDLDSNIMVGFQKPILENSRLRDQLFLDNVQDRIFRMPINSQCILSGPPGTGKTTTLIHRLGQKTREKDLFREEKVLVDIVSQDTNRLHEKSWLMFSPTELLRQYVKEAFNQVGVAAPDDNIRTWDEFRRYLAREKLGLLTTGRKTGQFSLTQDFEHLQYNYSDQIEWFEDFRNFVDMENSKELVTSAEYLSKHSDPKIKKLGKQLVPIADQLISGKFSSGIESLTAWLPELNELYDQMDKSINKILSKTRNRLTEYDKSFPDNLKLYLIEQFENKFDTNVHLEDDEDFDESDDENEESISVSPQTISITRAQSILFQAYKALARSIITSKNISKKSLNSQLINWLGKERLPSKLELKEMGELLMNQSHIRKFRNVEQLLLSRISRRYKRFRNERTKIKKWYNNVPKNRSDITNTELDLLLLTIFETAQEINSYFRKNPQINLPRSRLLDVVSELQWAQVLVDEATDFSVIQLACMYQLSHPSMRSFFVCGDLNQRLTEWGVKSGEELDWIVPNIKREHITISYRQSQKLVDLAKSVAELGGVDVKDITLPNRVNSIGINPVWEANLKNLDLIADWLFARINEINIKIEKSITIGVLVNDESQVELLANKLTDRLNSISLKAEPCKDGKVVGNNQDVRVFNIKHIKGLEFESVFFVGLDTTIKNHPELFTKYLYVGATRAATFLGITFDGEIPTEVKSLESHFGNNWE